MPRIVVNGLNMDANMFERIITAARGLFPHIVTEDMSDEGVIQSLILAFATEWVATWEARQAAPDPVAAAQQAMDDAAEARKKAEEAARAAASDIQTTAAVTSTS